MGQITRVLIILFAVWVVWRLARAWLRMKSQPGRPPPPPAVAAMQRCAHCGVYLPRTEAIESAGTFYCSEAHAQLGPRPT